MIHQKQISTREQLSIAVGTTYNQKLLFVHDILTEIELSATLYPADVNSGVSEQPLSSEETKKGSINRAEEALLQHIDCHFGLGIEVGYELDDLEQYNILCWSSITDHSQYTVSCCSHSFLLPDYFQKILKQGLQVGDFTETYINHIKTRGENHSFAYLGQMIKSRRLFIKSSVRDVLIRYLCKEEF